jgi:hypothetical protein
MKLTFWCNPPVVERYDPLVSSPLEVLKSIPNTTGSSTAAIREEPAEPGEVLRVSEMWAGCVVYRVRGESMTGDHIRNGDYLVVRPRGDGEPRAGQIVVAWLDGLGHVVKRLDRRGTLKSAGWSHRLTDADRILGTLAGVVRVC